MLLQSLKHEASGQSMSGSLLSMNNVSIAYPGSSEPSVRNVRLTIYEGECVLFMGPSGSGKSTLALAAAGLIPSAVEGDVTGEIVLDPRIEGPGEIAMVFQDPDVQFCMLQVGDEMAFGLENRKVPRREMQPHIQQALQTTGLETDLTAEHAKFSGGMKQKLAIASALVTDSQLLILDEPTANLDPLASRTVFDTIRRLRSMGRTMVVIEHKFDALLPIVDKVVLFDGLGQVHRIGPTLEVLSDEWDWLVEVGIVAPWKTLPSMLSGRIGAHLSARSTNATSDPSLAAGFNAGSGAGSGAGSDAGSDAGSGAGSDAGSDAGSGAGSGAGSDARSAARLTGRSASNSDSIVKKPSPVFGDQAILMKQASVDYEEHPVWSNVSFSLPRGSFTAVVGPNGSGKSTLLQCMAGLQDVDQGEVELLGRSMHSWKTDERFQAVSYCFQNPEFQFIFERVGDELANRVVSDEVPEEVLRQLSEFGLDGTASQSPFGLSQGQKRRLSVASMLREEHELYLLDEPTFGQDARTQQVIMDRLAALCKGGKTIVMSTHDMDLVRRYATHVVVLAEEGLLFSGSPDELFGLPDLMRRAHLLDDIAPIGHLLDDIITISHTLVSSDDGQIPGLANSDRVKPHPVKRDPKSSFAERLNPAVHLITVLVCAIVAVFAETLPSAIGLFLLPVLVMLTLARVPFTTVGKRYATFIVFYILYLLSFVLFSAVPPGAPHVHVLWWNISWVGVHNGLVLAFRMLSVAGFGILLVSVSDMTNLIVSLCQTLKVPPRLAYGVLAGVRFVPLFREEWNKLRLARMIRGRDARYAAMRPVTYALPLLSQAVRMSERVAIAMEARGFVGQAATDPRARTYYREVPFETRDVVYNVAILVFAICIVVFGNLWAV